MLNNKTGKKFSVISMLILCLLPLVTFASFEQGTIDLKMETPQGDVDVNLKISPKAVRSKILMGFGQFKMDMTFLIQVKENAKVFQINDAAKTYSEIDIKEIPTNIHNEKIKDPSNISYSKLKVKKIK